MTTVRDDAAVGGALVDLRNESRQVREALSALGRLLGAAPRVRICARSCGARCSSEALT